MIIETKKINKQLLISDSPILRFSDASGFTLIELIVVIAIMVLLASAMIINLAGQRDARNIKIAQNQLVSNLREIQSNTLSERLLPNGQSAQFYVIKFSSSTPEQYTIQAIYNVSSSPQYLVDVQTVSFPPNIQLAAVNPIVISRPNPPFVNYPAQSQSATSMSCALVAYAAPFDKVFLNDGCAQYDSTTTPPYIIAGIDDYAKILPSTFVSNTDCNSGSYGQPFGCTASVDSTMTITLSNNAGTVFNKTLVNGITGTVCPTADGATCLSSY